MYFYKTVAHAQIKPAATEWASIVKHMEEARLIEITLDGVTKLGPEGRKQTLV